MIHTNHTPPTILGFSGHNIYDLKQPEHPLVGMCWNLRFDITRLSDWEKFFLYSGESCADVLHSAIHKKILEPGKIKSACDFGAGSGVPTYIIKEAFKLDDEHIIALEREPIMPGLLDKSSVFVGDGIEFLKKDQRSFDLITACMLGPVIEKDGFLEKLLPTIAKSLNSEGKFLTYSDAGSMSQIKSLLDFNDLKYDNFQTYKKNIEAIAVSKEELLKLGDKPQNNITGELYKKYYMPYSNAQK